MNKILVGLLLGAALGAVDGMTAWFTPAVRAGIIGIVIGSTVKGMIAGIAAGWFARKVQSVAWGIAFGLLVGAILAYGVAAMQHGYYFEIMLPGSIVGAIVGWATQRYGRPARGSAATIAAIFLVTLTVNARAAEPVKAADAFADLKALAGTWNGHVMNSDGPPATVVFSFVSIGGEHAKNHPHVHNGFIHFTGNDQTEATRWMVQPDGGPFEHSPSFF